MADINKKAVSPHAASVAVGAAVLWLAVVLVVVLAFQRERGKVLEHAQQATVTLSAVLEEDTARTFDGVDVALEGLAGWLSTRRFERHDPAVRALMRAQLGFLPTVRALFVVGPDGFIEHDTDYPKTPDVSLADRPYFREYVDHPAVRRSLSPALQSRSGTGWFVASSHRISGPDGRFLGIVVAAVQLDAIPKLFRKLDLGPGQVMSLFQPDGVLIARYPSEDDANVGRSYARLPLFTDWLRHGARGVRVTSGPPLNYPRFVSYRSLDSQPLVVVLSTSEATALAAWNRAAAGAAVALLVFTLLAATGVVFYVQRQQQRDRALAHRAAEAEAKELAEANAKFRTFFEQGFFLSCVLALDGTVLEANDAALAGCGYHRDDVIGRKFWDCAWWRHATGHLQGIHDGFSAAVRGVTHRGETGYTMADGSQTIVELVYSPIRDAAGGVLSVAALGVDITRRKQHEEQLRLLADELRRADRLKGEFLATLSHELRNVLAPVHNSMNILDRVDPRSANAGRAREIMQRQFGLMRRLIDDLLDGARINSGKIHLEKERLDLNALLATAVDAAQTFMEKPGHRLEAHLPAQPLPVEGDRARLLQVVTNLLSNAAKYTPPGGRIQIRARQEGREAIVEVIDNGIGIPVAAQTKVFEMFEQVSGHLSRAQGGLGIGLALVRKLVALHGGHVEAHSDGPDLGSTFTVYLPLAAQQPASAPAAPTQGSAA